MLKNISMTDILIILNIIMGIINTVIIYNHKNIKTKVKENIEIKKIEYDSKNNEMMLNIIKNLADDIAKNKPCILG